MDYKEKVIALLNSKELSKEQKEKLEDIFPELAESEDERIRKEIIEHIKNMKYTTLSTLREEQFNSWIAWLEKQGQKLTLPKWKYKKGHTPLLRDSLILNKYGCVAKSPSGALVSDVWVIDYDELAKLPKEEFDRQGEQIPVNSAKTCQNKMNPSDKVEAKFEIKKGKWYVCTQTYVLRGEIVVIKGQTYKSNQNGAIEGEDEWLFVDKLDGKAVNYFKPWTIQDAKDGDVLVTKNKNIFIFKSISDCTIYDYCGLYFGKFENSSAAVNGSAAVKLPIDYVPATKEQRDLLFQKMKEARYEWDEENKELKKIVDEEQIKKNLQDNSFRRIFEQKQVDKVDHHSLPVSDDSSLPTFDESIYHPCTEEVHEQKLATWSEGNELHIRELESLVKRVWAIAEHENDKDTIHKMSDLSFFLKTLKPQLKQEWSEEDNKHLESILIRLDDVIHNTFTDTCYSVNEDVDWLKSLRHQNNSVTDEELAQAKKDAYNDALDKIEYHSGKPTFDDGWSAAIWYLKKKKCSTSEHLEAE